MLTACRAYAGEYPADWEYPGRGGVCSSPSATLHEGCLRGYGVLDCHRRCACPLPTVIHGRVSPRSSRGNLPAVMPVGGKDLDR